MSIYETYHQAPGRPGPLNPEPESWWDYMERLSRERMAAQAAQNDVDRFWDRYRPHQNAAAANQLMRQALAGEQAFNAHLQSRYGRSPGFRNTTEYAPQSVAPLPQTPMTWLDREDTRRRTGDYTSPWTIPDPGQQAPPSPKEDLWWLKTNPRQQYWKPEEEQYLTNRWKRPTDAEPYGYLR